MRKVNNVFFVHKNHEAEGRSCSLLVNYKTEREPVLRRLRITFLGFCLRVIITEKHIHLEKTTSSVLSVILINFCSKSSNEVIKCRLLNLLTKECCIFSFKTQ